MLILVPMAAGQGEESGPAVPFPTQFINSGAAAGGGGGGGLQTPVTGGPAVVLPVAMLVLGSGILTYAILRRR